MPEELKKSWERGDRNRLAERAGVSRSHLCNVLARRATMRRELAGVVAAVARKMGYALSWRDLVYPYTSMNPLLRERGL